MGTIFNREHEPPGPEAGDRAHLLVKTALGSLPVLGKAASELFAYLIAPPLQRRSAEWMEEIAQSIRRIESDKHVDIEALREDPVFIDTLLTATQLAVRTSQRQKLDALRNAVVNSALPNAPDATLQQFFLSMVDRFSELHLLVLTFFRDPTRWAGVGSNTKPSFGRGFSRDAACVLEEAFPELARHRPLYEQVWSDLRMAGLVDIDTMHNQGEGSARNEEAHDAARRFVVEFHNESAAGPNRAAKCLSRSKRGSIRSRY